MAYSMSPGGRRNLRAMARTKRLTSERAMRATAIAAWLWNPATNGVSFSAEWRDILALPSGNRLGASLKFLLQRLREMDRILLKSHLEELAVGTKRTIDMAVRARRFDNTWAWILIRGALDADRSAADMWRGVKETNGDRLVVGTAVEVSRLRLDKRFFPASLDDTETTYQALLEHSPNNIIRFDRELFPLYMNPAVKNFIACPLEELGAKKVAELGTSATDLEFVQTHVERVFATGAVSQERRSIITPNGMIVGDFTFWPEFDARGDVRSVISMQQDLTAEVRREKEAHTNELRFAALYQLTQMNDAPEDEVVRFVVEKIAELTGSEHSHLHILPDSLMGRGDIVWSQSHMRLFSEEQLRAPDPSLIRTEFGMDTSENEPVKPLFQNRPVTDSKHLFFRGKLAINRFLCAPALEGGKVMCLAAVYNKRTDYTAADMRQLETFINGAWLVLRRRRYIEQLKKAKEGAELANKVKNRFLATVSHELRTPLNGMLSMLQLLELSPLTPEQREYAQSAATTGQTLLRIISDILDYSKMESGRLELEIKPFDVKETITSAVELFQNAAARKGLALKLTLVGAFPLRVLGDEARIRQIVFNLVGNALKFTEEGEIDVFCEARPEREERITLRLTVRDTGIGIPVGMQNRVFEAFTQVDGSSTRKHQGSGLGLGIVRQLTRIMGGSINLLSSPGTGTLIECVLPLAVERPKAGLAEKEQDVMADVMPQCPPLTVLVAEDDTVSRHAMRLFLEKLGHRAVCVTNGREALEALRLYPFDCFISDVLMPELDGLEVTRHIRKGLAEGFEPSDAVRDLVAMSIPAHLRPEGLRRIPRDLPIVAVSAHAMKGDREYFLEHGMDYYLSKPMRIHDLAATLVCVSKSERAGAEPACEAPEGLTPP